MKAPAPTYLGPAKFHGGSGNKPIDRIVIHCTVSPCVKGGARNIAAYFRDRVTRPSSAHYVVDPGEVVQTVWDSVVAYHAPPNDHSLGVELCDPMTGPGSRWRDDDHEAMLRHAAELVAGLCAAYNVPVRHVTPAQLRAGERGICGHADVRDAWHQTTHYDPGETFPWAHFLKLVREAGKPEPAPRRAPSRGTNIDHAIDDLNRAAKANRSKPVRFRRIKAALAHLNNIKEK